MSIQLTGLDNIYKKLDGLTKIDVKRAIKEVESEAIQEIKKGAAFAPKASQCIGKCDVRENQHYYYIDIGLKNNKEPFEKWKELWFHEWGYRDKGLNFGDNGPYINMHKQWFTSAVNSISPKLKKQIKARLEVEIKRGCS